MFARKASTSSNELTIERADLLVRSREFLRMWAEENGPVTCFIDPAAAGADPFGFGLALVDAIRHGANAYSHAVDISVEDALARILDGFYSEMGNPTDTPTDLTERGALN
jgi:Domain of unknown function (DUF5076)